jgi:DNA replication protein DnaC
MRELKLSGAALAYEDLLSNSALQDLPFNDQIAYILDGERRDRQTKRLTRLSREAHPKIPSACLEDLEYSHERGLDKSKVSNLMSCEWIENGGYIIVTGPTGSGKTHVGCAFGNSGARKGFSWLYMRFTDLLHEFELAHRNGSYLRLRMRIARKKLIVIDDWALGVLTDQHRLDLYDVIDDRAGTGALLITSQLPHTAWHDYIGENNIGQKTVADSIVDRIVHEATKIELKGESQRKLRAQRARGAS